MGRLDGKVAVITGAASGMGLASARRFADEGATVVVADLDLAAAEKAVVSLSGAALAVQVDVGSVASIQAMYDVVAQCHGRIDVLFNHAGIPGPPGLELTEEQFDRTVDINLKSQFFGTSLALPLLRAAGAASIIYTSSVSGLMAAPSSPIYGMTKGGTQILMRSVAKQLGPEGIRANAICPGPTNTPMLRTFVDPDRAGMAAGDGYDQQVALRAARIPLRRAAEPTDAADVALFLASDDSRYVTGTWIPVDGGLSA